MIKVVLICVSVGLEEEVELPALPNPGDFIHFRGVEYHAMRTQFFVESKKIVIELL